MKSKIVSFISLVLAITLCSVSVASASDVQIQASKYLNQYNAYLYAEGGGNFSVWFEVQGTGTMDKIGALSIRLYEKSSTSSTWTFVKSYSHVNYPDMLGSNTSFYSSSISYSGKTGYSYKAEVTVWAEKSGNGDSRVIATSSIIA